MKLERERYEPTEDQLRTQDRTRPEEQDLDEGETGSEDSGVSLFLDRFFSPGRPAER